MENITFNGIPIITYGLIGTTTVFLAYSVFRDDSSSSSKPISESTIALPAVSGLFASSSDDKESKYESDKEKGEESEPEPEPTPTVKDESPPPEIKGGKRKHTRNKHKKQKNKRQTKHNRK